MTVEAIAALLSVGTHTVTNPRGVPQGAEFIRTFLDETTGRFVCVFTHESWDIVPEGCAIPIDT